MRVNVKSTWFLAALLTLLAGCQSLGLSEAKSFTDRLAYGYQTHTAVLQATATGLQFGSLSKADAQQVLDQADLARQALDAARVAANAGDTTTAEGRLAFALTALTALQTYLNNKAAASHQS